MNRRRLLWAALAVLMAIAVSSCSNEQKAPQAPERPYIPQVYTAAGLQEAVKSGGAVKLGSDVTITVPAQPEGELPTAAMEITRDTTINLNGKTLRVVQAPASKISSGLGSVEDRDPSGPTARTAAQATMEDMYVLEVTSGTLTISGNGLIDGSGMKGIRVGDGKENCDARLVINGGEVIGEYVAVHLIGGRVAADISGGKFSVEKPWNDKRYVLNIQDEYAGDAKYNVTGGTFEGFNPMSHSNDTENDNYVADGYYTEFDGDKTYTVKQRPSGTEDYKVVWDQAGLEKAVKSDAQVLLGADIKLGHSENSKTHGFLITEKDVTLDLNGHKLTADMPGKGQKPYMDKEGNMPYAILAVHDKTLTVDDSSSAKTGMIDGETGRYGGIWIHNVKNENKNATLVFNNGFVRCADNAVYLSGEEAQAIIRGGKFWADEDTERNKYYTLNILDENAKGDSLASFTVTGGSFYNFDPAANFADSSKPDKTTCYIDTSKYHTVPSLVDGETWYVVIPGAASN